MAVTVTFDIDELQLNELSDAGYTALTLWYSNTSDGTFADSSATVSPSTIAAALAAETYTFTFTYSAGSPAQWFRVRAYDGSNYSSLSDARPFHGGGGTTLATLRQKLGAEIRDMVVGTATGGSTATATVTNPRFTRWRDDYFNNQFFNNTTNGNWTVVTDWAVSTGTGTFTLSPAITSVTNGDNIEVSRRWTPEEYRDAINWAITALYPTFNRSIVNTGLRTDTNIYQFDVPHDIRAVTSVEIESWANNSSEDAATRGHPWVDVPFRIIRDGLRQKIEIERNYSPDRRLRIMGTGTLSQLYNDTDYVELIDPDIDIVVYYAAFHLYRGLPNDASSSDIDRYENLAKHYWGLAENTKDQYARGRQPMRLWSAEARASGNRRGGIGSWSTSI